PSAVVIASRAGGASPSSDVNTKNKPTAASTIRSGVIQRLRMGSYSQGVDLNPQAGRWSWCCGERFKDRLVMIGPQ
ncbi:MAG: hypothetical protein ACI9C1_002519, partial [Candidatus Aldehydirespiratoraceae bacterium]